MDQELCDGIRVYVAANPDLRLLNADETESLRKEVARRFGISDQQLWWWENLPLPTRSLAYSAGEGLQLFLENVPSGTQMAFLFVTDDDPPPWVCVSGPPQALIGLLAQLRFVECFMVDEAVNWVIFDTHHNMLVGCGEALRMSP